MSTMTTTPHKNCTNNSSGRRDRRTGCLEAFVCGLADPHKPLREARLALPILVVNVVQQLIVQRDPHTDHDTLVPDKVQHARTQDR